MLALTLGVPTVAQGQVPGSDPVKVKLGGYAQTQFNTTSVDDDDVGEEIAWSTYEFRRVRLSVDVSIRDWITGVVETDIAMGRLRPTDVFMNFQFSDAVGLRVGQFKKPFSRIELTSSTKVIPIERNTRIRGLGDLAEDVALEEPDVFTEFDGDVVLGDEHGILDAFGFLGRDIGMALHGDAGRFSYSAGLFNGAGANERDENDGKSFAVRGAYTLTERHPLEVGAGVSYRETEGETEIDDLEGAAFEADFEWGDFRRPGLHLIGEVATGENLAVDDANLFGAQLWASWFKPRDGARVEGWEPLLRVSYGDPNTDVADDDGVLFTPGVNVYFFGRNRLMLNWDVYVSGHDRLDTASAIRAQAQLHF